MLSDSPRQSHLKRPRKSNTQNHEKKSIKSLLKSYESFSDYVTNLPQFKENEKFSITPEKCIRNRSSEEEDSTENCSPSDFNDDCPVSTENHSLINVVIRLKNGDTFKCIKVKLMMNIKQFHDLRKDYTRLKNFKLKLQPIVNALLPKDDRLKSWTIDCIEPFDCEEPLKNSYYSESEDETGFSDESPLKRCKLESPDRANSYESLENESNSVCDNSHSHNLLDNTSAFDIYTSNEKFKETSSQHFNFFQSQEKFMESKRVLNVSTSVHNIIDPPIYDVGDTTVSKPTWIKRENEEVISDFSIPDLLLLANDSDTISDTNLNIWDIKRENQEGTSYQKECPNQLLGPAKCKPEVNNKPMVHSDVETKLYLSELLGQWDDEILSMGLNPKKPESGDFSAAGLPDFSMPSENLDSRSSSQRSKENRIQQNLSVENLKIPSKTMQSNLCSTPIGRFSGNDNDFYNRDYKKEYHLKDNGNEVRLGASHFSTNVIETGNKNNADSLVNESFQSGNSLDHDLSIDFENFEETPENFDGERSKPDLNSSSETIKVPEEKNQLSTFWNASLNELLNFNISETNLSKSELSSSCELKEQPSCSNKLLKQTCNPVLSIKQLDDSPNDQYRAHSTSTAVQKVNNQSYSKGCFIQTFKSANGPILHTSSSIGSIKQEFITKIDQSTQPLSSENQHLKIQISSNEPACPPVQYSAEPCYEHPLNRANLLVQPSCPKGQVKLFVTSSCEHVVKSNSAVEMLQMSSSKNELPSSPSELCKQPLTCQNQQCKEHAIDKVDIYDQPFIPKSDDAKEILRCTERPVMHSQSFSNDELKQSSKGSFLYPKQALANTNDKKPIDSQYLKVSSQFNNARNIINASFNAKPTCSILLSSRLKKLSKNKFASIATGKPVVPKKKEVPFFLKGKFFRRGNKMR